MVRSHRCCTNSQHSVSLCSMPRSSARLPRPSSRLAGPGRFTTCPSLATIPTMPLSQSMQKGSSESAGAPQLRRHRATASPSRDQRRQPLPLRPHWLSPNRCWRRSSARAPVVEKAPFIASLLRYERIPFAPFVASSTPQFVWRFGGCHCEMVFTMGHVGTLLRIRSATGHRPRLPGSRCPWLGTSFNVRHTSQREVVGTYSNHL